MKMGGNAFRMKEQKKKERKEGHKGQVREAVTQEGTREKK